MTTSAATFTATIAAFCRNYCLHSTLALGALWLLQRTIEIKSHSLNERLWKLAATMVFCAACSG